MLVKLILRIPPASGPGGPSTVTSSATPLLLTTSLPPLFITFPSIEPSTTTLAPGSMVKLPLRFPRICRTQFLSTIVSLCTDPFMSRELLTRSSSPTSFFAESITTINVVGRVPHMTPGTGADTCAFAPLLQDRRGQGVDKFAADRYAFVRRSTKNLHKDNRIGGLRARA